MPPYRLLALDIDGTVVNSRHELQPCTQEAILRAKAAGVQIVLATGRRYRRVLPLVESLEIAVPVVTTSGALIKDPAGHRTLYCAGFNPTALGQMLSLIHIRGFDPVVYCDTYHHGFDYYCLRTEVEQPELAEFLSRNSGDERHWPELITRPPEGVFAGFAMGTRQQMLELEAELNRQLGDHLYVHVLRSPRYTGFMCEIAPAGVSKWIGVLRLASQWGISADEICAVGDDVNDIPMIEGAGLGVAMANAVEGVKDAANRICPSNDDDGLVDVVNWILE
jgi:Cof subfamily protein (haloacid dehalogenase superfamily)